MARYQCAIVQIKIKTKYQCKVLCIQNAPVFPPHLLYLQKTKMYSRLPSQAPRRSCNIHLHAFFLRITKSELRLSDSTPNFYNFYFKIQKPWPHRLFLKMILNVSSSFLSFHFTFFVDIFPIGFQSFENSSLVILIKKILMKRNACNWEFLNIYSALTTDEPFSLHYRRKLGVLCDFLKLFSPNENGTIGKILMSHFQKDRKFGSKIK